MNPENSVKGRLKQFISYLNISEREFCRNVGVGSAYVASIKKSIPADKMEAISSQYPELNPVWLLRGDGEMLLPGVQPKALRPASSDDYFRPSEILIKLLDDAQNEKARLLSIIESQQRTIERLTELTKKADVHRGDAATSAAVG